MQISKAILHLQTLQAQYGDIEVVTGGVYSPQPANPEDIGKIVTEKELIDAARNIEWNPHARPSCELTEYNLMVG